MDSHYKFMNESIACGAIGLFDNRLHHMYIVYIIYYTIVYSFKNADVIKPIMSDGYAGHFYLYFYLVPILSL